ncbi:WYL domain-containing protein [Vibrio crassostreae]|uniref:helix-turn-helix transcriptional regulator n=1 Tax=Vibrio crassostreae TaxID=246167 RepID=UPI001FED6F8F|nr:WYL domain-containing protein [Vibrio crassostreae]CAK1824501.1 WYL domain-containing protein [Vibrio crassostreae]CAK1943691.1 WYL domain-containing protein [Vibrio crassostreae]CAK2667697.1 WYL domain-containing protein [Vibrio crassostreae]CAK2728779.1 WYL domain-containing protein [Vibrio crassostreae]CAK2739646.1 WYL domain-containing protein [Vibrio crassostreae]
MSKTTHVSTRQHMVLALELYKRIPYWHKVTASELKAQLQEIGIDRDIRTIQRNLDVLLEYFDIDRDTRDKPYGYQRKQTKSLVGSSTQEALLLCLVESHIHYLIPSHISHTLQSLFEDANYRLKSLAQDSKESQWLRKIDLFGTYELRRNISLDAYAAISQGLYHNRWLNLHYYSEERQHRKDVMPLGLVQQSNTLILVYRQKGNKDATFVDVSHIHKVTLSTFTFAYPQDFDLQHSASGYTNTEHERYTLEFTITKQAGEHLYQTPLSNDQRISEFDTYLHITVTVSNTPPLVAWLEAHKTHITFVEQQPIPPSVKSPNFKPLL